MAVAAGSCDLRLEAQLAVRDGGVVPTFGVCDCGAQEYGPNEISVEKIHLYLFP